MKITVADLINNFDLKLLNPKAANLTKEIKGSPVTRAGLELSRIIYKDVAYVKTVVGWGTKENKYLSYLAAASVQASIKNVLDQKTPLVVISKGFKNKDVQAILIQVANEYGIGVAKYEGHLADIIAKITDYAMIKTARSNPIHGSLMVVNGVGVLIKGPSGIGKSEAQLELIQKGHIFVSDDAVEANVIAGSVHGSSSPITKDLLEIRGIGLMNVPFIYGAKSVVDSHRISLIVELVPAAKMNEVDRLGNSNLTFSLLGVELPLVQIPNGYGRSISSLIEAAVNVFIARQQGMDPIKLIAKRGEKQDD